MQESPVYAVYEIPAYAGMTVFRTTVEYFNKNIFFVCTTLELCIILGEYK